MRFIALALCLFVLSGAAHAETAYERVMRTGTLRCGYLIWPPHFDKDAKTGKFSGLEYDYLEAMGRDLHLKIDWALEVTPGQQVEALKSGKIDAMCGADGPMYPNTLKYEAFSEPLLYIPMYLYERSEENRFDKDWHRINDPSVKISMIDGDVSGFVSNVQFPDAKQVPLSQLNAPGQMMLDVAGKKADILINDAISMSEYKKSNPGILRKIPMKEPIAVLSVNIGALRGPQGDDLLGLLNAEIDLLRAYRKEDALLAPYIKNTPDGIYPAARPWKNE